MSPDSSFSPRTSSTVQAKATSVLMVAPSSSSASTSPLTHRSPASSSNMIAPLNLHKFERPMAAEQQQHHNHYHPQQHMGKPTAIATAVIRVQVPECNSSGMMRYPASPSMVSVSTNNNGNGSHSPFMVPPPAPPMYSNVIVMNKKLKPEPDMTARPSSPDYAKSYPVMEPTVASSSSNNYSKGEPELNIGMRSMGIDTRRRRKKKEFRAAKVID